MNRSVPPSPGDKARHLMFQPRRSSRTGAPRWFPPEGEQAETEATVGATDGGATDGGATDGGATDGGATDHGAGGVPAEVEPTAAVGPDGGYVELGWEGDGSSDDEPSAVGTDVGAADVGADALSEARSRSDAASASAAIRAASVKAPDAVAEQSRTSTVPAAPTEVAALLVAQTHAVSELARRVEELARLRRHDADLVDRLHAENSRLRQGELTEALAPLLRGLIRIHDQMASLGGEDTDSVAGILKSQLLQVLDLTVDVRPFDVPPGTPFDPARHVGVRSVTTEDPELDRTTVRTVKPGFVRGDCAVVRPAETEVYRAD